MLITTKNINDWYLAVSRNLSFLHQYLSMQGNIGGLRLFGFKQTGWLVFSINRKFESFIYYSHSSADSLMKEVRILVQSKNFLQKLKSYYKEHGNKLLRATKSLTFLASNRSSLIKVLDKYFTCYANYTPALNITALSGRVLTDDLYTSIQNQFNCSWDKAGQIISILTFPDLPTPSQAEELDFLKIVSNRHSLSESQIVARLKLHYEYYSVIPANFVGELWGYEYFYNKLKNYSGSANITRQKILMNREKMIKKRNVLFKKLNLDTYSRRLIMALRVISELGEYRKFVFSHANVGARPILQKIALAHGFTGWQAMHYLTPAEIVQLEQGKSINKIKEQYEKRRNGYAAVVTDFDLGKARELNEQEVKVVIHNLPPFVKSIRTKDTTLRGFIGNKGCVRGPARLVLKESDFAKVKLGDILIARMTSADYIMVMKKRRPL
ncbi:MAG: hypothetical protein AAB657_00325 [Patescibacteria group bacterium]